MQSALTSPAPPAPDAAFDLVIIGGGPAGMSAALMAGRARLRTALFNTESPRNAVTRASHSYWTRDGESPAALLAVSKAQLERYTTVAYDTARVTAVQKTPAGFTVTAGTRVLQTARVIIATGFVDDLDALGVPGMGAVWGKSVFPCPVCDGFEHRDDALAVIAPGASADMLRHYLAMVTRLSSANIHVFTHGHAVDDDTAALLQARSIGLSTARIAGLDAPEGALSAVRLEDGTRIAVDAGFALNTASRPATSFAADLGAEMDTHPAGWPIAVADAEGVTSVPGLFVVGDVKNGFGGVPTAAAQGYACAMGIIKGMAMEGWLPADSR